MGHCLVWNLEEAEYDGKTTLIPRVAKSSKGLQCAPCYCHDRSRSSPVGSHRAECRRHRSQAAAVAPHRTRFPSRTYRADVIHAISMLNLFGQEHHLLLLLLWCRTLHCAYCPGRKNRLWVVNICVEWLLQLRPKRTEHLLALVSFQRHCSCEVLFRGQHNVLNTLRISAAMVPGTRTPGANPHSCLDSAWMLAEQQATHGSFEPSGVGTSASSVFSCCRTSRSEMTAELVLWALWLCSGSV